MLKCSTLNVNELGDIAGVGACGRRSKLAVDGLGAQASKPLYIFSGRPMSGCNSCSSTSCCPANWSVKGNTCRCSGGLYTWILKCLMDMYSQQVHVAICYTWAFSLDDIPTWTLWDCIRRIQETMVTTTYIFPKGSMYAIIQYLAEYSIIKYLGLVGPIKS